jgi:hypothetical protein
MERHFRGFTIEHLPRKKNVEEDDLVKEVAKNESMLPDVFFENLNAPSIKPDKQPLSIVNATTSIDWRSPTIAFLRGNYESVEAMT